MGVDGSGGPDVALELLAQGVRLGEERRDDEGAGNDDSREIPVCDLVIRSYYRDFGWLRQCLASISRWCTDFRRTVVVLPRSSYERWTHLGVETTGVELVECPDFPDDYLGQQVSKLYADTLTDAELVWHVDADCIFSRATTPAARLRAGRPTTLMERYASLDRHVPWKEITERFLGRETPHEFMRQPPYVFPRWLYGEVRAFCERRHGLTLADYVLAQPPRGFSEFNALSGYAWHFHRDSFDWIDLAADDVEPLCRVFWSRTGLSDSVREEIEALLA